MYFCGLKMYTLCNFWGQQICRIFCQVLKETHIFGGLTPLRAKCLLRSVDQKIIHSNTIEEETTLMEIPISLAY